MTDETYLSGCAIYKNEAPYLAEWLEFHRLVGFEKFHLYDNGSTDNHREVLEPYVREGFVEITDWPIHPGQIPAYEHCLKRVRHKARWLAFFDIDEFCYSPWGTPVSEVLGEYEQYAGVAVCIVVYGTSGHAEPPSGPVIANYVMREQEPRSMIKSIVDPRHTVECLNAHYFRYLQRIWPGICAEVQAVDEQHRKVPLGYAESATIEKLRLNHYYYKSEREAVEKFKHGQADTGVFRDPKILDWLDGSNQVEDRGIQMYLPVLLEALKLGESLKSLTGLSQQVKPAP